MKKLPSLDIAKNAGELLSDEEVHFLRDLKGFVDYGLRKGVPFRAVISVIAHDVDELARDRFDFQRACKRKGFQLRTSGFARGEAEMPGSWLAQSRQNGKSLSKDEIAFLGDFRGFIDYGIRNGISFRSLMAGIGHDVHELQLEDFDFQAATKERGFSPTVSGYAQVTPDSWDVAEDGGDA
jgi:hypothetical protein